jgi:hypothetical protein
MLYIRTKPSFEQFLLGLKRVISLNDLSLGFYKNLQVSNFDEDSLGMDSTVQSGLHFR